MVCRPLIDFRKPPVRFPAGRVFIQPRTGPPARGFNFQNKYPANGNCLDRKRPPDIQSGGSRRLFHSLFLFKSGQATYPPGLSATARSASGRTKYINPSETPHVFTLPCRRRRTATTVTTAARHNRQQQRLVHPLRNNGSHIRSLLRPCFRSVRFTTRFPSFAVTATARAPNLGLSY